MVLESTVSVFTMKQNIVAPGTWLTRSREWRPTKDEIEPQRHVLMIHFFQLSQLLTTFQKEPWTCKQKFSTWNTEDMGQSCPAHLPTSANIRCVLLPLSFNLQSNFLFFSPRLLGFGQIRLFFSFDSRLHDVSHAHLWFNEISSKLTLGEFLAGSIHAVEIPHKPLH